MWHSEVPLYEFKPFTRKMTVAVKHDCRRESSSFWLAVVLEDVQIEVNDGNFVRQKVSLTGG